MTKIRSRGSWGIGRDFRRKKKIHGPSEEFSLNKNSNSILLAISCFSVKRDSSDSQKTVFFPDGNSKISFIKKTYYSAGKVDLKRRWLTNTRYPTRLKNWHTMCCSSVATLMIIRRFISEQTHGYHRSLKRTFSADLLWSYEHVSFTNFKC